MGVLARRLVLASVFLCTANLMCLGEACVLSCHCTAMGSKNKSKVRKVDCAKHPPPFTSLAHIAFPLDTAYLDLKKNQLTILRNGSFIGLSKLTKLNLSHNQITIIEPGAFAGLESLRRLDLSWNQIGTISSSMFTGLPKLEKLFLSRNRINTIPEGTFNDLTALKRIDFNSEYLRCDCHLSWMVRWAKDKGVRIQSSTKCQLPDAMKGRILSKLKTVDLHCKHDLQLPFFVISPQESQIVFEGDKLPFNCRASFIHADTHIAWIRKGVAVETNKSAGVFVVTSKTPDDTIITHTLALNNLQKSHSGVWSCQVSTPQGKVSRDVSITVIKDPEKNCPHIHKITNKGNYTWHETIAGVTVKKPCKVGGKNDFATYYCDEYGYWKYLNISQCDYVSDRTRMLHRLAQEEINATTVFEYISKINMTLNLPMPIFPDMSVMDAVFVSDAIDKLKGFVSVGAEISDAIVEVVNNVTMATPATLAGAQMQKKACSRFVLALENMTQQVAPPSPSRKWSRYAFNMAINVLRESLTNPSRIYCALEKSRKKAKRGYSRSLFSCSRFGNTTDDLHLSMKNIQASADIPPTLLQDAGVAEDANIQVTVYRNHALFPRTKKHFEDPVLGDGNWSVVSQVFSIAVEEPVLNLSNPITLNFHVPDPHASLAAVYWDFGAHGGLGDWCTDGCEIVSFIGNITTVKCYHLSNFAILQENAKDHYGRFIMEPIIYVGSCICMLCMMAVIITYVTCFRMIYIPKKMKHSVINICISVLLLIVAFTMGINRTDFELVCQIAGIAIHYLTLCAVFWITITSNNMFKKFLKAERPPSPPPEPVVMPLPPKPILRFYFLGWGVPIIICGITAAVNFNFYSGSDYCFLAWEPSLGAFYGPVALLVVLNLIFFLRISCVIRGQPNNLNETDETEEMHVNEIELVPNQADTNLETQSLTQLHNDDDDNASSISILDQERRPITQLRALVAMLFLYIVAWVCGAFAVARPFKNIIPYQELIFSYLYGVTSALLGVFMVGYFCLMRRDSRLSWKRFFGCGPQPLYSFPVNTDPPTQVTQVNGNVVKSNSSVDVSTTYSQKSSNIAKAYQMKNNPGKQSNINLVPVPNSSKEGSVSSNQEGFPNFYNPRQNGAAKKFWQKNRHTHSKIMNKDVNKDLNCDSMTDNMSTSDINRRLSQGTNSDANTHLSIEIQIQTKDSAGKPNMQHGANLNNPGIAIHHGAPQLPMNIQHSPGRMPGPPMDRSQMTPVGGLKIPDRGGAVSPCCNLTPGGPLLPQHQRSPSACSLGTGSHPSAFTPVAPRNNTLPRQLRAGVVPVIPAGEYVVRDGSVPRLRDFDGQSQVSDNGMEILHPQKLPVLPSHVDRGGQNGFIPPVSPHKSRNDHIKSRGLSPRRNSRPSSGERVHSPNTARPLSGDYSSDSSRYRCHKRNHSSSSSVVPRTKGDGSKSPVMSDDQSRDLMCPADSDGQLHSQRRPVINESDHHSDPTHRKRHRPYDKYSRHRGMQKQRSLGWEEQFKDRPRKIAYAYVNHSYQEKVLHKLISQASESDDLAKKAFWLPRSMSEYDRLTQSGFRGLLEDTSSTSEDDSFDNVWLPQQDSGDSAFKKETSV
ncbi:adhesion G protein-coupled receptor A3-like [Haliotis asinina]|uniref:adhesion G protein-coupled receptor A3-like n=1 Tax=Haliotis asinina TaxID=109174 RepID=UPI003532399C